MAHDFPAKLRITAILLSCSTGKELCARFRAINAHTGFDVERSRKWLQGKALPRSAQVYEDWARVLGSERGGTWLAAATLEAFVAEIAPRFDADPANLLRHARAAANPATLRQEPGAFELGELLSGSYAAYSHAWSPYHLGLLIRGTMSIAPDPDGGLRASYSEAFTGRPVRWSGAVQQARGALNLDLREVGSQLALFICVFQPRPPGCALVGTMSGASFIGPEPRPSTTRIVLVRSPQADQAWLERSNCYLDAALVADDLCALGLATEGSAPAAELLVRCLHAGRAGGLDQVTAAEQNALAASFDALYLSSCFVAEQSRLTMTRNPG